MKNKEQRKVEKQGVEVRVWNGCFHGDGPLLLVFSAGVGDVWCLGPRQYDVVLAPKVEN